MNKKEIIQFYLENDVLISPDSLENIETEEIPLKSDFIVINSIINTLIKRKTTIATIDFERSIVMKEKNDNGKLLKKFLDYINETHNPVRKEPRELSNLEEEPEKPKENPLLNLESETAEPKKQTSKELKLQLREDKKNYFEEYFKNNRIKIIMDYDEKIKKRTVQDFVNHFSARYKEIERILRQRQELQGVTSIGKIITKKEKDNVAIIGYVYSKAITKANNIIFTIEDPTGLIKVVVNQKREDLFSLAQEIQLDEVIGITGMYDNIMFANNILLPDIPLTKELKKSPEEGYFVVITDPQVGSKLFLEKEFQKFLLWINGDLGNEKQKEIASKVKYLFIVGDLVDGVGIYPDQEFDLNILDVTAQYEKFTEYIKEVPKNIPIFVCPGNHDVGRISEPQPRFHDEYTESLMTIPNLVPVSNPSVINIFAQPENNFEGFDVLLYHGYSFVYYSYMIPSIRQAGGQKRPDLIMKYLLQRRHLAPSHTSALYVPEPSRDHLTISTVPDFFFSGHVHRASVNNYRNVTCINASCWVSQSSEQERRGLEAQPGRAFIINMQTREVKMMNFLSKEKEEHEKELAGENTD
jgi:DNA polymerase II small subunit